jgi:hypothetical protein
MKDIGFDIRELEYYLECHGLKFDDFLKWVKHSKRFEDGEEI